MNKQPDPIDIHIGQRIRVARTTIKMSQGELGQRLDVSCQQIQKYEKGQNRIAGNKLYYAARALKVREQYFFDDYIYQQRELRDVPCLDFDLLCIINSLTPQQKQHLVNLMISMVDPTSLFRNDM